MAKVKKYKIERGIKIPPPYNNPRNPNSFNSVLRRLKVGQSVLKRGSKHSTVSSRANEILGAGNYVSRKMDGGVRVWRIK